MRKVFGRLKAVSPLISTVLLIAMVVAIAGIVGAWLTGFIKITVGTVGNASVTQITCGWGGIALSNIAFSNAYLSGHIDNIKNTALGKITLQLFYTNITVHTAPLCASGGTVFECASSNFSLEPGIKQPFNISAGTSSAGNIDFVRVYTHCSDVSDQVDGSEIS